MLLMPSLPMSIFTVTAKEYPKGTLREPAVPVTKSGSHPCAEKADSHTKHTQSGDFHADTPLC